MSKREKEIRFGDIQFRNQEESDEHLYIEGYAIVWDTETLIGSEDYGYYEQIARMALKNAHKSDVVARYNHNDTNYILGRTRNGSLELIEDDYGLKVIIRLQKNVQAHVDLYNMVRSGLIDKMSFAFTIKEGGRTIMRDSNGRIHTVVNEIDRLFDVSPVDVPAYSSTSIYARSVSEVETELLAVETVSAPSCEKRDYELDIIISMYK